MTKSRIVKNGLIAMVLIMFPAIVSPHIAFASQWVKTYEGLTIQSIQQTSDGGYVVAGLTTTENSNASVSKLNADGTILWQKSYGSNGSYYANSIQQTKDEGYIVAGRTNSFGAGGDDVWVLKLNPNGTIAWQKAYGGKGDEEANSIQQTSDGGYIVAGVTTSFSPLSYYGDSWVFKLDSDGSITWQKTFRDSSGYNEAKSVNQTADGGYILTRGNSGVLKLNGDGSVAWQKTFDRSRANSVKQTPDGGYIVAGFSILLPEGIIVPMVLKLDGDLTVAWQKTYVIGSEITSIHLTSDGGYIVSGDVSSPIMSPGFTWVLKLNEDGAAVWITSVDTWSDVYSSVYLTSDGEYVIGARHLIMKLNSNGTIPNCSIISSSNNEFVNDPHVTFSDTSVIAVDTNVIPQTSSAIPIDTNIKDTTICFFAAPSVEPIPTLSQLGLMICGLLLGVVGLAVLYRMRATRRSSF